MKRMEGKEEHKVLTSFFQDWSPKGGPAAAHYVRHVHHTKMYDHSVIRLEINVPETNAYPWSEATTHYYNVCMLMYDDLHRSAPGGHGQVSRGDSTQEGSGTHCSGLA